ncbi:MAG: hypothetical protein ACLFRD_10820, partial [Nitriliruptoraceae bacterium]
CGAVSRMCRVHRTTPTRAAQHGMTGYGLHGRTGMGRELAMATGRGRLAVVAWCVALAMVLVVFHALADGALAAPPPDPSRWGAWAAARGPLVAVVAVLRLVVLALAWYLAGATALGVAARLVSAARLVRFVDALSVPPLRRLLQVGLGVSLATTLVATAAVPRAGHGHLAAAAHGPVVTTVSADPAGDDHGSGVAIRLAADGDAPGDRTTVPLPLERGSGDQRRQGDDGRRPLPLELLEHAGPGPDGGLTDSDGAADAAGPGADGRAYEVVTGDSFWRIATEQLTSRLRRPPSDGEVAAYVARLVTRNRDRLADPHNPDLIFPGQRFELVAVEEGG